MGILSGRSKQDHRFASENLSAYLDGALTAREVERLERHLAQCEACRQDLATLRRTVALLNRAPLRPAPRSFALPRSAQPQQTRYRRWSLAYSFMQTATVAVATVLVVMVSGDALFSLGLGTAPGAPTFESASASEAAIPAATPALVMAQPAEQVVEKEAAAEAVSAPAALAQGAPAEQPQPEGDQPPLAEAPTSQTMVESAPTTAHAAKAQGAPTEPTQVADVAPLPRTSSARPVQAAPAGGVGSGGAGGPGEVSGLGGEGGGVETGGGAEGREFVAFPTARPPVTPLPTPATTGNKAPQPTLGLLPSPTPVLVARQIAPTAEAQAQAPAAPLQVEASPQPDPWWWRVRQATRLISLGLVGALCILGAGLLWAGHKKRL